MTGYPLLADFSENDVEAFRASGEFDEQWYLNEYPDVARSGIDPARHYLWIGRKLGRRGLPLGARSKNSTPNLAMQSGGSLVSHNLDALFIDGTNGTSSTPYRVFRIANGLAHEGWNVRCVKGDDLQSLMAEDLRPRFTIFHRAPYWSPAIEFAEKMRSNGSVIVFDIDDLVFDESVIPFIDGYRHLNEEQKQAFLNGVNAYRTFIMNADMCTSTTSFLVDEMRKMGKIAYKIPNAISSENIKLFDSIDYKRRGRPSPFVVAYYSGTKTHQSDFAVSAPALIQFMHENPDVVFRIVGEFDLSDWPELESWQYIHRAGDIPRVTRVGLMPHDVMIRDQLNCDIILAPLEVGNPFCEAKSELKFFEASLAKAPVIASATRTFVEASDNGRLAHLAVTTDDWLNALRAIYHNYPASLQRASAAQDYVKNYYSQRFAANSALDAYEDFASSRTGGLNVAEINGFGLTAEIGVILPDFSGPSGGHRKIFTVCQALERHGYSVKLYFYSQRAEKIIRRDIHKLFGPFDGEICCFTGEVDAHSHLICTQWKSAYDARNVKFAGKILYFIQDFEPMFYAVGSDFLRALTTYSMNFEMICYGKWVSAKLFDELGVRSATIPFTLDHATYSRPVLENERDIDILVFARPSQDRRCLDLIIEGLAALKLRHPSVHIALFGEDDYPELGFEFTKLGSFSDLGELAALYRRSKIGICYSPTNPSQLGYEMVACGVCLIDVRIKFAELNFDGDDFVRYCNGTPEDMRDACEHLLFDENERRTRQARGYAFVDTMPNDEELGRAFIREAGLG